MKHILVGSNRRDANSLKVGKVIQAIYADLQESVEIIDLAALDLSATSWGQYKGPFADSVSEAIKKINESEGLIVVCPEYNGSMPGAFKYFIDHWNYPETFEYRPVCFVGVGGRWGGLRPIEHLQGVFGYRNAYMFPIRVFISNVWDQVKGNEITSAETMGLLVQQAKGFQRFVKGLQEQKLDANSFTSWT